jgi:hypothetical protein
MTGGGAELGFAAAGQVVDTPSAQEFASEIARMVSDDELTEIADQLREKSERFQALLAGRAADLADDDLRKVLRSIFSTRRKADRILETVGPDRLRTGIAGLLDSGDDLADRVRVMDALLADFPEAGFDLPGELLHFTYPERYWLWSRWMWDPRTETGSLPLVVMEEHELGGDDRGEGYLQVGQAIAFVQETGRAAGFTHQGPFGIDVFLASVYAVYMYTVLRLRMTQEFNQVVPQLSELVRRLLGVYRMEV